ncbi:MAG: hypothetical protein CL878_01490 [Dehalococcoidia bacterium]|nr:hypothetical protein [Dehalococcoidia bacterium]
MAQVICQYRQVMMQGCSSEQNVEVWDAFSTASQLRANLCEVLDNRIAKAKAREGLKKRAYSRQSVLRV